MEKAETKLMRHAVCLLEAAEIVDVQPGHDLVFERPLGKLRRLRELRLQRLQGARGCLCIILVAESRALAHHPALRLSPESGVGAPQAGERRVG
eukprot:CAMPEP_0179313092 /NCGR_PEP_ID=MMETSP0797-20121207/53626_1 /TAXON_ID=47934 /ORGANISM="Dinophysis acuminata, Strain DAEP01" /LENGTH=93 /DNA_ID=CAMNT_0021023091 /DNA_START=528 /DNA_END=806 /DNA_ORIENTATION=-